MREEPGYAITAREEVIRFFRSRDCHVVSFAGYGELGYQEEQIVERIAKEILAEWNPRRVIVNSGTLLRVGGEDGIARVCAVARSMGIVTAGIHPSVALKFAATHQVSACEEHVFFVEDASWGGFLAGGRRLSPTLETILQVSDELVVVGGGKHAADELAAFLRHDKKVRYFPAEMNQRATRRWCRREGLEVPDYRGAAYHVWLSETQSKRQALSPGGGGQDSKP